jgi:Right handed beta helix region
MRHLKVSISPTLVVIALCAGLCGFAEAAAVLDVGGTGPYATIQAAVDAANPGDRIRVAAGNFNETIEIGDALVLEGGYSADFSERDWDTNITVINALRTGRTITVDSDADVTIEGFTITGGLASDGSGLSWGGGIYIRRPDDSTATATIRHNIITDNIAQEGDGATDGSGGGIHAYNGHVVIEHNTITHNVAQSGGTDQGDGGGIRIFSDTTADIVSNTITHNTAVDAPGTGTGRGGGIHTGFADHPTVVRDNEISQNTASVNGEGYGGGIYANGQVLDNRIISNTASVNWPGFGGGVYANWCTDVNDNTLESNVASLNAVGVGGGINANQLEQCHRNTIRLNYADRGAGVNLGTIAHTEVRGNLITLNHSTGLDGLSRDGGGGILSVDDDAEIIDNRILLNTAVLTGGGIQILGGDSYDVRHNVIASNEAQSGAGILVHREDGTPTDSESITHNLIVGNSGVRGGGMFISGWASPSLDSNTLMGNTATGDGGQAGGGIMISTVGDTAVQLSNHIVAGNLTGSAALAGGIQCGGGVCQIHSCTVADNEGTGVRIDSTAGVHLLRNSIIVGHTTGVQVEPTSIAGIDYNCAWDNLTDIVGDLWGANHREEDPQFVDRAGGDYHLSQTSTLADVGDAGVLVAVDVDVEPRPRGAGVDIGADEIYRTATYVSAATGSDLTGDGSAGNPFATVALGLEETTFGGRVHVARGIQTENLMIDRTVELLGGYRETDWSRDTAANTTTLNGGGAGPTVTIVGETTSATVEGFTITGGEAGAGPVLGGGVRVQPNASALIRRNVITGNHAAAGGGGVCLSSVGWGTSLLLGNHIHGNTSSALTGARSPGAGVLVIGGPAYVFNNFIHGNDSILGGDGIGVNEQGSEHEEVWIYHNTLVDNEPGTGEGIWIGEFGDAVLLSNNLIVGHGTGIVVEQGSEAVWDHSAFFDNTADYSVGLSPGANDVSGDPDFLDRVGGDLHILTDSAALDTGADLGIPVDIDGEARPQRGGVDIGADECPLITSEDVVNHLIGTDPLSSGSLVIADDNEDGPVDAADVVSLVNQGL